MQHPEFTMSKYASAEDLYKDKAEFIACVRLIGIVSLSGHHCTCEEPSKADLEGQIYGLKIRIENLERKLLRNKGEVNR